MIYYWFAAFCREIHINCLKSVRVEFQIYDFAWKYQLYHLMYIHSIRNVISISTTLYNLCILQYNRVMASYNAATWYHLQHSLWSRHNGRDNVSNHQPHDCLLNRLFTRRSKKTSKLRVIGFCAGNSPEAGEFPAQMASNAENVSIWWRHHEHRNGWVTT